MGNPQLTYGDRGAAHAGGLVYGTVRGLKLSKACETAAGINFGVVVSRGSTDDGCVVGGSTPIGVALRDHGQGMDALGVGMYAQKSLVSVIDKDFVWMETVSTSGAYRARVYYDTTTGSAIVTASPTATQKLIGYLGQTLTAAGLCKVFVDSDLSYPISAFTPTAPVTELAAAIGDTQSVVTWVDPADADIDHIVVQTSVTATGAVVSTFNVAAAAETKTVASLTNGTEYTVSVWVLDDDGNSSAIVTDTVTPSA